MAEVGEAAASNVAEPKAIELEAEDTKDAEPMAEEQAEEEEVEEVEEEEV